MENKLSMIEEMLLCRAQGRFISDVEKAAVDFVEAVNNFATFGRSKTKEDIQAINNWASGIIVISENGQMYVNAEHAEKLPDYIKQALLEGAIWDFVNFVNKKEVE